MRFACRGELIELVVDGIDGFKVASRSRQDVNVAVCD